jgi:hypothetical protein
MRNETTEQPIAKRRFVSERKLSPVVDRAVKTLPKDRLYQRGFPWYRNGRQILYDLDECLAIIERTRVGGRGMVA